MHFYFCTLLCIISHKEYFQVFKVILVTSTLSNYSELLIYIVSCVIINNSHTTHSVNSLFYCCHKSHFAITQVSCILKD